MVLAEREIKRTPHLWRDTAFKGYNNPIVKVIITHFPDFEKTIQERVDKNGKFSN